MDAHQGSHPFIGQEDSSPCLTGQFCMILLTCMSRENASFRVTKNVILLQIEEAQIAREAEEQMRKEMERFDRERRKEEERLMREQQREDERLLCDRRRESERREKYLQKESIEAEKKRQKEELRREKEAERQKAAVEKATARRIAKESMELMEDEQLELMELAAAELKEDITAEESFETKKCKLADLGIALLADPESNIKLLKEMLQMCNDHNHAIVKLGLLSLLAVFKDIIPGYRIRLPTEKELVMKVSKDVKKMRYYESTLLSAYKVLLDFLVIVERSALTRNGTKNTTNLGLHIPVLKLMVLERVSLYQHAVVRCICTLLDAVPHFNYCESLIEVVVRNISSSDEVIRKLCCDTIKSLFTNEGKHSGEVTGAAVRLIANYVKAHNCQMHPDSIQVLISLSFDEDLHRSEAPDKDKKVKKKNYKKGNRPEESSQPQLNDRKKSRQEMMSTMREEIYFRILKHTMQSIVPRSSD
ncbi:hypothetical protein EUGRSUZ_G02299 [Eucalyptus grandis]|uniref:Uncharacterized protein n=2 Tax=Eucalyptus grandis TaxID=71139 RepID=A0ACC3K5S3_EUCGR|nr:hypothetical protein EUGRSUZ_G02299 [Eucalyptus grandis]